MRLERDGTTDGGAPARLAADFKRAADAAGAVIHDVQPQPIGLFILGQPDAVVCDGQFKVMVQCSQMDQDS